MQKFKFTSNPTPTVGVEIEMALVDPETGALKSAISDVLNKVPPEHREKIKPELMQCYMEVNSDTCNSIDAIEEDLRKKILAIQSAADESGAGCIGRGRIRFPCGGTRRHRLVNGMRTVGSAAGSGSAIGDLRPSRARGRGFGRQGDRGL